MTISMKGIVLLVVVQISVVLCASTGKPSDKDLEGPFTGIPADVVQDGTVVQLGSIISKGLFSGISAGVVQDGTVVQVEKIIPSDTSKILEKQTVVQDGTGVQLSATIPSKMLYDGNTYKEPYSNNKNARLASFAIFAILFVIFTVISLFIGCIVYLTTKKPRRGHVVANAQRQESEMPPPSVSPYGSVQPIQHPSQGGQNHQQNISSTTVIQQSTIISAPFVQPMQQYPFQRVQNQQQNFYPAITMQQTTIAPAPSIQPMQQFPSEGGQIQQSSINKLPSLQSL